MKDDLHAPRFLPHANFCLSLQQPFSPFDNLLWITLQCSAPLHTFDSPLTSPLHRLCWFLQVKPPPLVTLYLLRMHLCKLPLPNPTALCESASWTFLEYSTSHPWSFLEPLTTLVHLRWFLWQPCPCGTQYHNQQQQGVACQQASLQYLVPLSLQEGCLSNVRGGLMMYFFWLYAPNKKNFSYKILKKSSIFWICLRFLFAFLNSRIVIEFKKSSNS